jgi:hypothetical protein
MYMIASLPAICAAKNAERGESVSRVGRFNNSFSAQRSLSGARRLTESVQIEDSHRQPLTIFSESVVVRACDEIFEHHAE